MGDRRAELTVGRDYCRGCKGESVQGFAGYANQDANEVSVRPRAFYRQCRACGTPRLVLQNVTDAEGLCRAVLSKWLKGHSTGAAVGATERPFGDGSLDADDGLAFLQTEVWKIYLAWQPHLSHGSFLAYASAMLPQRLSSWARDASGEASDRAKGRRHPKAHAASVSVSLDGIRAKIAERTGSSSSEQRATGEERATDGGTGGFTADHAETGSPDLFRVLTERGGGRDGDQRRPRRAVAQRFRETD